MNGRIDKSHPFHLRWWERRGLEWWAAWVLETDVGQQRAFDVNAWEKYTIVLYLKQTAGAAGFGPAGPTGTPFPEVEMPPNAEMLFEGQHFRMARATSLSSRQVGSGEPPAAVGQVIQVDESHLKLRTDSGTVPVELTDETRLELGPTGLIAGIGVQVWGRGKPFSRTIVATLIVPAPPRPPLPNGRMRREQQ